jgi:hypothetical protein
MTTVMCDTVHYHRASARRLVWPGSRRRNRMGIPLLPERGPRRVYGLATLVNTVGFGRPVGRADTASRRAGGTYPVSDQYSGISVSSGLSTTPCTLSLTAYTRGAFGM